MTASVSAEPTASGAVTSQPLSPQPIAAAAAPAPTPAPRPEPVAVATAPSAEPAAPPTPANAGFLPVPELRSGEVDTPQPAAAPSAPPPPADAATLEERMLAGSAPDESVANSYASASEEEDGLTGMVLKLIKKQQEGVGLPN